jgi:transposase-like protein
MLSTMSLDSKPERVEVITGVQRRRRWTPEEKLLLVQQTYVEGKSVSLVARQAASSTLRGWITRGQ